MEYPHLPSIDGSQKKSYELVFVKDWWWWV